MVIEPLQWGVLACLKEIPQELSLTVVSSSTCQAHCYCALHDVNTYLPVHHERTILNDKIHF